MSYTYSDKTKEQQSSIDRKLSSGSSVLGIDDWDGEGGAYQYFEGFGLCSTCNSFWAIERKYGKIAAICERRDIRLNSIDPITVCTNYTKRGQMPLNDMKEIAILIDPPELPTGFK